MLRSDFSYTLPAELIAQQPVEPRSASRLLALDGASGVLRDLAFADLTSLLRTDDLLVFNDTRVIPARVFGAKETGGRVELLIERVLDRARLLTQVRASKPPKAGGRILLEGGIAARVHARRGEFYELELETGEPAIKVLERIGHVPLPPYIARADEARDRERYQTVFARAPGAVAAPTAGLHFDETMLAHLQALGIERAFVTLHVGAGTFQPVRVDDIREHRMHAEWLSVSATTASQVNRAVAQGRRVVAVGTTVVRALESAAQRPTGMWGGRATQEQLPGRANAASSSDPQGCGEVEQRREQLPGCAGAAAVREDRVAPFEGETDIFIHPGYRFRVVDALLTNFHLPESTLLMLVCAFGGTGSVLAAYRHAVAQRYRFYSYGDAMFVTPQPQAERHR
jgi:S-adenosylmethionine:tRNA ribosyltransferase-isomerase